MYGVYYAAAEGTAKALIADLVPAERRGTAYGLFNAAVGLMAFPASAIAGLLWQGAFGWNGFGPIGAVLLRRRAGAAGRDCCSGDWSAGEACPGS